MDLKSTLRAVTLELRRELEGKYDVQGNWQPGDLERRLAAIGVRRDRAPVPVDELTLSVDDREARRVVDAFVQSRAEADQTRETAIGDFVREAAYSWANRLLALRCMEARGLIDEVILQKEAYGGRSLQHNRLAKKQPERCAGEDEGLFAALFDEFSRRAEELPLVFDPGAPEVALRPSVAALKHSVGLLSGTAAAKGQNAAKDEVFTAPDALGWTYQYWNTEEKDRVFEKVRTRKGAKIEGAEIVPATCIYTEPYMVKFLVQNSLGALWMAMNPASHLSEDWAYYLHDADRAPIARKSVAQITFLDPACGSGHFLLEAFELFYAMYIEEGTLTQPAQICASILERNLYGIDIDERAAQIAALALVMKAKEKAPEFIPRRVNLVATNIRLPAGKEHLDAFLRKHPEDAPIKPALLAIFEGLAHADELGSLLQIEEPVEKELRSLKKRYEASGSPMEQQALWAELQTPVQGKLPMGIASYEEWQKGLLARIREHFDAEANDVDLGTAFFGEAASKGFSLLDLLARRYDVVAANPPYMGSKNMGPVVKSYLDRHFAAGRRDLYAAFILRVAELLVPGGLSAMVTMSKWLHARAYAALRCGRSLSSTGIEKGERGSNNLLFSRSISVLADLGSRAFDPDNKFHDGVRVVMFVVANHAPSDSSNIAVIDATTGDGPTAKQQLLARAAQNPGRVRRSLQRGFADLPGAPICYGLPDALLRVLRTAEPFGKLARVRQGICTTCDPRFIRMNWEIPGSSQRWFAFAKGGGHRRWDGLRYFCVDWGQDGKRIKEFITDTPEAVHWSGRMPAPDYFFQEGWGFSRISYGNLGVRYFRKSDLFGDTNPLILFNDSVGHDEATAIVGLLNSPLLSYVLRAVTQANDFREGYLWRLPYPRPTGAVLDCAAGLAKLALKHAQAVTYSDPREATYKAGWPLSDSDPRGLASIAKDSLKERLGHEVVVCVCEQLLQRLSYQQWNLSRADIAELEKSLGTLKLTDCLDELPLDAQSAVTSCVCPELELDHASTRGVSAPKPETVAAAQRYLSSGLLRPEESEDGSPLDDEEDESVEERLQPPFGLVDAFARGERVDLGTSYRALVASLNRDGPGPSYLLEEGEELLTLMVLRLLGHQWKSDSDGSGRPDDVGQVSGIIPIAGDKTERLLVSQLRGRLVASAGERGARALESEFQAIAGKGLGEWIATSFFPRHVSRFMKRPIVWQIESTPGGSGRRQGRRAARRGPAFSCLVHYWRLNADLLPKLKTQYVGPLRTSLQTELGSLERLKERSAEQDTRRLELDEKLEELKEFDSRLQQVILEGFASSRLDRIIASEPLDSWTSKDGRESAPATRESLLAQEHRYDPDLNDGVRVNIAPLQRAGLFPADVLAGKDLEKAIADRAEWRADERRWCRDGKLPQPGWWPTKDKG